MDQAITLNTIFSQIQNKDIGGWGASSGRLPEKHSKQRHGCYADLSALILH